MSTVISEAVQQPEQQKHGQLRKVLGPGHIWALGVGIVLVGEFMGWNFSIAKGGSMGSLIACWAIGLLYVILVMCNSEIGCVMPEAGGQYAQAKYILGPLAAFNVGLMLIFEYTMLEAADALVIGELMKTLNPAITALPWILLSLAILTVLNYRGIEATLTVNLVITFIAYVTIFILLFGTKFYLPEASLLKHKELMSGLPYGWIGIVAALQFGIWYYLGIEGAVLGAEECRSPARSLPVGMMAGVVSLLVGATITWYVASGLVDWVSLGKSVYPLYEAALNTKMPFIIAALFVGTALSCLASANGCIIDSSRAWYSMAKDHLVPNWFGGIHPQFRTPYRAVIFLVPISASFAFTGLLDQVIAFSILSAVYDYLLKAIIMFRFRRMWPMGSIERGYISPWHPLPATFLAILVLFVFAGFYLGYAVNLLAGTMFYIAASIWFVVHRSKFLDYKTFIKKELPRPQGY